MQSHSKPEIENPQIGVRLRNARLTDIDALARLQITVWKEAYQEQIDKGYLDSLTYEDRCKQWKSRLNQPWASTWVAEQISTSDPKSNESGEVNTDLVGYACAGPARFPEYDCDAELISIDLREDYRGKGIGEKLVIQLKNELMRAKFQSLLVRVLRNSKAVRFYEKFSPEYVASAEQAIGDKVYDCEVFRWRDINTLSTNQTVPKNTIVSVQSTTLFTS